MYMIPSETIGKGILDCVYRSLCDVLLLLLLLLVVVAASAICVCMYVVSIPFLINKTWMSKWKRTAICLLVIFFRSIPSFSDAYDELNQKSDASFLCSRLSLCASLKGSVEKKTKKDLHAWNTKNEELKGFLNEKVCMLKKIRNRQSCKHQRTYHPHRRRHHHHHLQANWHFWHFYKAKCISILIKILVSVFIDFY